MKRTVKQMRDELKNLKAVVDYGNAKGDDPKEILAYVMEQLDEIRTKEGD